MQKFLSPGRILGMLGVAVMLCASSFADDFGIGSKAPNIDVEFWLSDNDGLYQEVTKFEEDKVYVINFWATRSGPSILEMPRLAELQKKFDGDVQFISISIEDLETVEKFLAQKVPRDKEKRTFQELTNGYCLTADPDKSVFEDYFEAAGKQVIPCAFVVGKTTEIEWIGFPMNLEKPLQQIVDGEWDREKFKVEYDEAINKEKEVNVKRKLMMSILQSVAQKMRAEDEDGAIDELDKAIEADENELIKSELKALRLQIMLTSNHDGLAEALKDFVDANKDDAMTVNNLIWTIYEKYEAHQQGKIDDEVSEEVLKVCLAGAKMAAETEPEEGAILDTYAHFIYVVEKDLDKAIKVQKQAIKYGGPQTAELQPFLDELLEEKKTGKKPSKKKKKKKVEESDF